MCVLSKLHLRHLQWELGNKNMSRKKKKSNRRQSSTRATYFSPCLTERVRGSRDRARTVSNSHSRTQPRPSRVCAPRLCHAFAVSMVTAQIFCSFHLRADSINNCRHCSEEKVRCPTLESCISSNNNNKRNQVKEFKPKL